MQLWLNCYQAFSLQEKNIEIIVGVCVPVRRTNALCSWIALISLIQMDKTVKDIIGTLERNYNYHWIKELSTPQYSVLKAVNNLGRLFRFGFYSVFLNAEPWTPLSKRRKLRSSKQLPVYRDRSRDTEEGSEHPILCHWQSCKIYLKCLLSIDTSKTHFHLTSTFWNKKNR